MDIHMNIYKHTQGYAEHSKCFNSFSCVKLMPLWIFVRPKNRKKNFFGRLRA